MCPRVREGAIIQPSHLMITCPALAPRAGHHDKRSLCPARTHGNTAPYAMAVKQHAHGLLPSRCLIGMHTHGGGGQGDRRSPGVHLSCGARVVGRPGVRAIPPRTRRLHLSTTAQHRLLASPHSVATRHRLIAQHIASASGPFGAFRRLPPAGEAKPRIVIRPAASIPAGGE
jgi:hypothetical protein